MKVASYFKSKTKKLRRKIAQRLVPKMYDCWLRGVIKERQMIRFLETHFEGRKGLVGIEIGVYEGSNALSILNELPMKRLYLIDPYVKYEETPDQSDYSGAEDLAKERFSKFPQVIFIKKYSSEAISHIPEQVDFVYIDGNHLYDYVKSDIQLYFNVTKVGGIIGGHDYATDNQEDELIKKYCMDVSRAVDEFVKKNNLKLFTKEEDWWLVK